MPRRALASDNIVARIRAWFGLDQAALALYLGISPSSVHSMEAGRRTLTTDLLLALRPLMQQLPPAEAAPPAVPLPGLPPPDAGELGFRWRVCAQQAAKLERELATLEQRAQVAAHWAQALPALQKAAAETYAAPATPEETERGAWLAGWLTWQARPLPPETGTRCHLLRARGAGLRAEMAALAVAGQTG